VVSGVTGHAVVTTTGANGATLTHIGPEERNTHGTIVVIGHAVRAHAVVTTTGANGATLTHIGPEERNTHGTIVTPRILG
jgi:hypothetical protein